MPITLSKDELLGRINGTCLTPLDQELVVYTDASDFFALDRGNILILGGNGYLIRGNTREGRFGLDDEVKFWVKRATDLATGALKIIKIPFFEKFNAHIAGLTYECYRSPGKESRILQLVAEHPNFMHGISLADDKDNNVRVMEFIHGPSLADYVASLDLDHERYFHEAFAPIFEGYLECVRAIAFLHGHLEKHGDIRRDHVLIDRDTGRYRWIDFDYNYRHRENMFGYDLFGLGNILAYIVGHGDVTVQDVRRDKPALFDTLWGEDLNIIFRNRVMNLAKIFPYIPRSLNEVLRHFSPGANYHYENTSQFLDDLEEAKIDLVGCWT
jgi:serine/threonine protein kinase